MELVYSKEIWASEIYSDGCGRLDPSMIALFLQETAGEQCRLLGVDNEKLGGLFWAVLRYRAEVTRLPEVNETITVKTWPMPTTKTAFPRAAAAYDAEGKELFRIISLWVLMDKESRQMVLPGKSGVTVDGIVTGDELPVPAGLRTQETRNCINRIVHEEVVDGNEHMNNVCYIQWALEALPEEFRKTHRLKGFTASYFSEVLLYDELQLRWALNDDGTAFVDSYLLDEDNLPADRAFAIRFEFDAVM